MYANMMTIKSDEREIKIAYAQHLNQAINDYWDRSNQDLIKEQSDFYNKFYSWGTRAKEWNRFFEEITQ
jgi:hypothetical protein